MLEKHVIICYEDILWFTILNHLTDLTGETDKFENFEECLNV